MLKNGVLLSTMNYVRPYVPDLHFIFGHVFGIQLMDFYSLTPCLIIII